MQPIYGTQCIQPTRYNPPRFHNVGTFMIVDVANQLNTTHRASLASEPFPHFRGVGNTPCIHGVGIFYGTQRHQSGWYNPLHFHGVGTFYGTQCSQPARSSLPHFGCGGTSPHFYRIGIFCGPCCSQPTRYNPSHFHGVGTLSTLLHCRNCSTLPWHRNLLWQPIYGTCCTQPTRFNLPHSWRRNPLWYSMQPTSLVQPFALPQRRNPFHTSTV